MPRPQWKGHLSFGLVMMPVMLLSATESSAELDFDMVDKRDLNRIKYLRVNEKSGKEVPWKQIVKALEVESGQHVILEPSDFQSAAKQVTKGGIEILDFVKRESISPIYFEKPYYLLPGEGGGKGYALLRTVLKETDRVGVAKVVIQTRQRLAALMVDGPMLILITMRFAQEIRSASDVDIPAAALRSKVDSREVGMAEKLVESMVAEWEPSKYHDDYRDALRRIIKAKSRGPGGGKKAPVPATDDDIPASYSILDLLRDSVAERTRPAAKKAHASSAGRGARPTTRRKAG